jgi:GNAT superfamily N-acetyltransferase
MRIRAEKTLKLIIHLKRRQPELPDMPGKRLFDAWASGDQNHIVPGQGLADFDDPEEMSDAQNVLTVNGYFHGISRLRQSPSGGINSVIRIMLKNYDSECLMSTIYSLNSGTKFRYPSSKREKMNIHRFSIEKIKLGQLYEFARSSMSDPRFADVSPISLIRALAQSKNPHAAPQDIALLVGYENSRCVGYHGLLPGYLSVRDRLSKVYWLVTFYLMPPCRCKGYGKRLVQEIQRTGVDLVTTGITDAAEGVYRSAGFQTLGELVYYRIGTDESQPIAPGFEERSHWDGLKDTPFRYKAKAVQTIDKHAAIQQKRQSAPPAFLRDPDAQNWMLQHPWVVSRNQAKSDVKNYYFSRVRDRFNFIGIEFFETVENQPGGYMTLSVSSRKGKTVVKILDVLFQDPEDYNLAAYTGLKYAATYGAQRLEFPARLSPFYLKQPILDGLIKKKKRLYLFYPAHEGSTLAANASRIELNYCDGDTAFT